MGTKNQNEEIKKKIKSYQNAFKKYKVHPKSLFWATKKAAEQRYKQLVADLDFEGKTVLDVGCGFGNIIPFISKKAKNFSYTGVDAVPEFIKAAQKKYPKHRFLQRDYFNHPLREKFDVVISSGALNSNFKNPYHFRKKAIKTMFDHAREKMAFNMAGFYPQPKNKKKYRVFFANSLIILKYCLSLSSRLIFRHHYNRKEFTIIITKKKKLSKVFSHGHSPC